MSEPPERIAEADVPVIDSHVAYSAALRWGFAQGFARGARRIVCADTSLDAWPLDDPALLEALAVWLRLPQRRLVLLASHHAGAPRRLARFDNWRAHWMHAIDAWQAPPDAALRVPSVLLAGDISVCLVDAEHGRGSASRDPRRARQWEAEIDAVLQRCEPALPLRALGL